LVLITSGEFHQIHSVFLRSERTVGLFDTGQKENETEDGTEAAADEAKT